MFKAILILSGALSFCSFSLASTHGGGVLMGTASYTAPMNLGAGGGGGVLDSAMVNDLEQSTNVGGLLKMAVRYESESSDGLIRFSVLNKETMETSDKVVDGKLLSLDELRILESSMNTGNWVEF